MMDQDDEEQVQLHEALPNDLFLQKILPLLRPPDLGQLRLVSRSWSVLCRENLWSAMGRAWCRNQRWLVMLCRNPCNEMELVACCIPAQGLPSSSEDIRWMSLSSAIRACIDTLDLSYNTVDAYGYEDYKAAPNKRLIEHVTMYPLDDRCLISGMSNGLMCLIWHANLCWHPLRPFCPPPTTTRTRLQLNTASFTPMLVDVFAGSAELLPAPDAYFTFAPEYCCGTARNVFMAMQMHNPATMSFNIILHDDHLNYLEVYSSETSSWRTVVHRKFCATDDYPSLNFTTPRVHLGDVFAIRHKVPGALYAYRVDVDEWSKVNVQHPPNALKEFSHAFKYNGRVFLAALLMIDGLPLDSNYPMFFNGFAIWELKCKLDCSYNGSAYAWEQVARSPDHEAYQKFFCYFYRFQIKFVNVGGLVCMTGAFIYVRDHVSVRFPPVVYDIACDSWFFLPECRSSRDYLFVCGFLPKL